MKLPTTTLLTILQQSEYDLHKTKSWMTEHQVATPTLEPENWTPKLKVIRLLFILLGSQWWSLELAVRLTQPIEWLIRRRVYGKAQARLLQLKKSGAQCVIIAGSFAKTSTKAWLAHLLAGECSVAATPKSINTMLGIAHWILDEVPADTKVLLIELGEYRPGDLKELLHFIQPSYGILTPIGLQHLEMFGSLESITHEFRSVIEWFANHHAISHLISTDHNHHLFAQHFPQLKYFGDQPASTWRLLESSVTKAGTEAEVAIPEKQHLFTPILGAHQVINGLPAFWLATELQLQPEQIKKRFATMPYIHRRHEPTFAANNVLILDNSYNTNATAIDSSLAILKDLKPTRSFVITLGFTETGEQMHTLHHQLGAKLAQQIDYLGLAEAPWSTDIVAGWQQGGGNPEHLVIAPTIDTAFAELQPWVIPGSVILFEGGYQEVYVRSGKDTHE